MVTLLRRINDSAFSAQPKKMLRTSETSTDNRSGCRFGTVRPVSVVVSAARRPGVLVGDNCLLPIQVAHYIVVVRGWRWDPEPGANLCPRHALGQRVRYRSGDEVVGLLSEGGDVRVGGVVAELPSPVLRVVAVRFLHQVTVSATTKSSVRARARETQETQETQDAEIPQLR